MALTRLSVATWEAIFLMARKGLNTIKIERFEEEYIVQSINQHIGTSAPLDLGTASVCGFAFLRNEEVGSMIEANARRYADYNVIGVGIRNTLEWRH
jgi:DNA-binding IclR family transcriptional regulator